ncbi:hypothetical protein Tco_0518630, partial [Tanacetum coccineum]
ATASEEASWLRCLLAEIPLWEKSIPAVLIHCDSTAAIAKVQNAASYEIIGKFLERSLYWDRRAWP